METGLFSTRTLRASGLSRADIRRSLETAALPRVRRGWYAVRATPRELVVAAQVGGRLSCVSALRLWGAWTLETTGLHVRVSSGVDVGRRPGVVLLHWTSRRLEPGPDDVEDALMVAVGCLDLRSLVIVMDSLANRRVLSVSAMAVLLHGSARGRRALELCDPRAESGIETIIRLALRRLGIRLKTQVTIDGVGRVDILIGDRLVVELDGYAWHSDAVAFERDRTRDRELVRRGYIVVRASYRQVLDDVDAVVLPIRDVIARRDHRWRAVHRAQLSRSGLLIDVSSMSALEPES